MPDRDDTTADGLDADSLPEPTGSLAEFYRAVDGTSRGRKREYYALDEIPGDQNAPTHRRALDEAGVELEDEPDSDLLPLFLTPPVSTDERGTHRDEQGRLYDLVEVDGEAVFEPVESDIDGEVPPTVGQVLAQFQATQQAAAVALEHWGEMDEQTRAFAWEHLDDQQRDSLVTAFGLHDDPDGTFAELWQAAGAEPEEAIDQAADVDGDDL